MGLSARLRTRHTTRPWAHSLTPWGCYFSMYNVGHLHLRGAFGITGMLDAQPYQICFSWGKRARRLHPAPPSPLPGRLDSLHYPKGVLFSPLPASSSAACVLESVSPSSIPFPLYPLPHPKSSSTLVVCRSQRSSSSSSSSFSCWLGQALISISIAGFLRRLPHRPGGQTRSPLFSDGMFSQP